MVVLAGVVLCIAASMLGRSACVTATPLDDYVKAPDPTYSWRVNSTFRSAVLGYTAFNIELTSQTWMTSKETNQPVRASPTTPPLPPSSRFSPLHAV